MTTISKQPKSLMDEVDRRLLNILQSRFPLVPEPYKALADELAISESEVLTRIASLKKQNVIREINAIFDTRRLGYSSTLVAMRFPPNRLQTAARKINKHPGVSHNYARDGYFNLWFTLAVPPHQNIKQVMDRMEVEVEAEATRIMPTIRFFKIGVNFDMEKKEGAAVDYYSPDGYGSVKEDWNKAEHLSAFDIEAVRELQKDLPLIPRPFDEMAHRLGISVCRLFTVAIEFQERRLMRRYSAVLNHRRAGFKANAMAVWRVPEERSEEVGQMMAASPWVTHCYQRPTFPDWPYTHFTMIHATSRKKCEDVAHDLSRKMGVFDYKMLYSTREYKKTRVRYFVEQEEGW